MGGSDKERLNFISFPNTILLLVDTWQHKSELNVRNIHNLYFITTTVTDSHLIVFNLCDPFHSFGDGPWRVW